MKMVIFNSLTNFGKVTYIFQNVGILIAIIGIPLNILTFKVYLRKRFKNFTFPFYIRAVCIVDSIVLIHTFRHWATFVIDANVDLVADVICKLAEYSLLYVNGSVSVWLLCFISLDRLMVIVYPLRFSIMKNKYFQFSIIFGLYLFSFLLYMSAPVLSKLQTEENFNNESNLTFFSKVCEMSNKGEKIVDWTNLINLAISTFLFNNILTILMMIFILRM